MPGLLRAMVRTGAVVGTATAVNNRVNRRQYNRWAEQDAASYQQPSYDQQPPAPANTGGEDRVEQLKELAALKDQGVLTDDEFAAEKARILRG